MVLNSSQPRFRTRFEIDDFQLQAAPALPIIKGWRENETTLTVGGHQIRGPLGQIETDRGKRAAILLDAKTKMALASTHGPRLADHVHGSGQEKRPRIAGAIRLQPAERLDQAGR